MIGISRLISEDSRRWMHSADERLPTMPKPETRRGDPQVPGLPPALIAGFAGAALFISGLAAAARGAAGDRWLEVSTPQFRVVTNAGARKARELARSFTLFQWALSRLQPDLDLEGEDPITVLAFDDEESFAPYKLRREEEKATATKSVIGQFFGHPEGTYILVNAFPPGRQSSLPTVYHEYVHFFVAKNLGRVPLWFNEGLAVYYSSFEIRRDRLELGLPPEDFLTWARHRTFWPFDRLFAEDGSSPKFLDPEGRTTFYAQSWALVHFLLTGDEERSRRAGAFLSALNRGQPAPEAWAAAFGEPLTGLEKSLRGYVNQPTFPYKVLPITRDLEPASPEIRELSAEEAQGVLDRFLELSGQKTVEAKGRTR
jgi:hypothetical protein